MNGPDSPQETIALNAAMLRLFKGEYGDSGLRHSDALFVKEGLEQAEADLSALRGANEKLSEELSSLRKRASVNTQVRLFDLVRNCRVQLHEENLITDDEYAWLSGGSPMSEAAAGGSPSPMRLEDYDELRAANSALVEALEIALKFFSAMPKGESPDGKGGAWDAWTTGMHAIKDALAAHKPAGGGKQSGGTNRAARLREGHPPTAEPDYTSDFRCSGVEPPTNSTSDAAGAKDTARPTKCPECGDPVTQERDGTNWCENCGWPEDHRVSEAVDRVLEAVLKIVCGEGYDPEEREQLRAAIDVAMSHQTEGGK